MKFRIGLILLALIATPAFGIEVEGKFSLKARVKDLVDRGIPQDFFKRMSHTKQPIGIETYDLPFPVWGASAIESLDSLIAYINLNKDDSDRIGLSAHSFFRFSQTLDSMVTENVRWTLIQNGFADFDHPSEEEDLDAIFEAATSTKPSARQLRLHELVRTGILEAVYELKNQLRSRS